MGSHVAERKSVDTSTPLHSRRVGTGGVDAKALVAVNSALRDWIKGQVTAIETGILSFEAVFMPHMITNDGRPMIERVTEMLPAPTEQKAIAMAR